MAQRVFAGMLNESLTILTVRYSQVRFPISHLQQVLHKVLFSFEVSAIASQNGAASSGYQQFAILCRPAFAIHLRFSTRSNR